MARSTKKLLAVYFGDMQVFVREVDSFECEESLDGSLKLSATFTPVKVAWEESAGHTVWGGGSL